MPDEGIDVSNNNGFINWPQVKQSRPNLSFAFCKCTEGIGFVDADFARNIAGANSIGYRTGGYHFANPSNNASDEAAFFLQHAGDLTDYILDLEQAQGLNPTQLAEWAATFLGDVYQAHPGSVIWLYSGAYFFINNIVPLADLDHYPKWVASYGQAPTIPYTLWQDSDAYPIYSGLSVDHSVGTLPSLMGDDMQPQDFFKHLTFREGGYINIRRNGEADIPNGQPWHGYTVLRADGAEYQFPYNGINMYSQLPATAREIADPKQDYIVDAWQ